MTVALCGISAETQHGILACVHPNHRIVVHILQHRCAIYINHLGSGISLFKGKQPSLTRHEARQPLPEEQQLSLARDQYSPNTNPTD